MLGNASLVAFIATTNAGRARSFYQDVLGLRFVADDGFALLFDANGTTLRIARVESLIPHSFTSLGWHVDDIAGAMLALVAKGVAFEHYGLPVRTRAAPGRLRARRPRSPGSRTRTATCCR
jgi:catechol 2,3-dioxygenase-like lactoylglutathione lyase family enzyme